jgi:hypothetical protein
MKNLRFLHAITLGSLLAFSCCKKDTKVPEPETPAPSPAPSYTIPTTYNFSNISGTVTSTQRIAMLGELTGYIRATHTTTSATQPTLSAQKLKDIYVNANSQFTNTALNSSGVQLKDKTGTAFSFVSNLETSFDDAEMASSVSAANPTTSTASNGVKGKLVSSARAVLVDANGFEYKEFAEKGIMGALFYFQATTLLSNIASFDNANVVNGNTAQETAWDEAFGYFGVPIDFPTNLTGLKNWGSYCNSVNVAIGSNTLIMNAFLKGRAAIANKDNTARDTARDAVIAAWEKVGAAKCISYIKGAKNNLTDEATLHHNLSEAYGFILAFQYNPGKIISNADIATLVSYFGNNLYTIPTSNLDLAISKLESVFGLNAAIIP